MLKGVTVALGVTGGIAAYKACEVCSSLVKLGAKVNVIMTKNATEFVRPLTFEVLSNNPVTYDMWERKREWEVEHVSIAQSADVIVVAPATANLIGKLANGVCDDMLTTTIMASNAPVVICPAMNVVMYENPILQENVEKLKKRGYIFVEPEEGRLACGAVGRGRLAPPEHIVQETIKVLGGADYANKKVLITAGGTSERIDGVRYITNRSSGKMGACIARSAMRRGAEVILVVGNVTADMPKGAKIIRVESTEDMYKAVMDNLSDVDIVIKSAAPADYKVLNPTNKKIKDEKVCLELTKNVDIAREVGKVKGDKKLVIFAAETENLLDYAKSKLVSKNADMVVANDVTREGAGFNHDTNDVVIIHKGGREVSSGLVQKSQVAEMILDELKLEW
ncbi:MAG: bifunctional phosphopantothenoylcysteine decarboxylase/phosphopantothenate--cysteine ligase CoaBC [Clostridia bacterium]|nr:bifunctional phosphopantothenoylcysteine decarboxylase/phosphopantothenate--cysteine ligase CoaBC [Clostridia bacterium]